MDNIIKISEKLRNGEYRSNPYLAADDRSVLAGEFAWIMGQLEEILQRKPAIWVQLRENYKSDTACEKAWEKTPDGLNELGLKLRAKSIEKMMSALGSLIRLSELEAKNI